MICQAQSGKVPSDALMPNLKCSAFPSQWTVPYHFPSDSTEFSTWTRSQGLTLALQNTVYPLWRFPIWAPFFKSLIVCSVQRPTQARFQEVMIPTVHHRLTPPSCHTDTWLCRNSPSQGVHSWSPHLPLQPGPGLSPGSATPMSVRSVCVPHAY